MADILTVGEILVEVMAVKIGQSFEEIGEFAGPFPSGAPAIFIDQAAKIGSSSAIVSKVGDDGFGRLNINRLRKDGVDVSCIKSIPNQTTGIAFITYNDCGDRDFIFTIKDSPAAKINQNDVSEELFIGCNYFHIMGCSLFNNEMINVFKKAILLAKKHNVKISFDPNIRKEIMEDAKIKDCILFILENCDFFLPGVDELKWITGIEDEKMAVRYVLNQHASAVIVKRGSKGCTIYERTRSIDVKPYEIEELDPTGAGDSFAGTFISLLNQGLTVEAAVKYANAAGAYAVLKKGPMEGTSTLDELELFIKEKESQFNRIR